MKKQPYILLADDDRQVVDLMKLALEEGGYEVTATTLGKDVVTLVQQRLPDLLILDLNMPGMDGFDVLKILRAEFPYLRILVISGYLKGSLLDAAKFVGAFATMQKPFGPQALVAKVREVLGSNAAT